MFDAIHLYLIKDFESVRKSFRNITKDIVHLLSSLKPLLLSISHTVRVVKILTCRQAEQMVVSLGSFLILEVAVVGTHKFDTKLSCHFYQRLVGLLLQRECLAISNKRRVGNLMALKLKIIVITKDIVIPFTSLACTFDISLQHLSWHLACYTSRAYDETLVVFLKVLTVGTWTIIVAIHPCS